MKQELSEEARKVLASVSERAMDGYTLLSRTGLSPESLSAAVKDLADRDLLLVKGDIEGERVLEAYFAVPHTAKQYVHHILKAS